MMHFFDILGTSQGWMYLFILSILEIVLGIDNIIFISLVTENMQQEERKRGRRVGLTLALVLRIILLMSINWLIHFDDALFTLFNLPVKGDTK